MSLPVLGIDLDGCMVDNDPVWRRWYSFGYCGRNHGAPEVISSWNTWPDFCDVCYAEVLHSGQVLGLHQPRPSLIPALFSLHAFFDLHIVTARTYQTDAWPTGRWLDWCGLSKFFEGVHYADRKSKVTILKSLGAVAHVEDSPTNITAIQAAGIPVIIFDALYNKVNEGTRVTDWLGVWHEVKQYRNTICK
jgi:hypothetical protein